MGQAGGHALPPHILGSCENIQTCGGCAPRAARFSAEPGELEEQRLSRDQRSVLNSILIAASAKGKTAALLAALEHGANIEARKAAESVEEEYIEASTDDLVDLPEGQDRRPEPCLEGLTPLMRSARAGQAKAVALLLERRASPHARDEHGRTPLHFAAAAGSFDACLALLRAGGSRWKLDKSGRDAYAHLPGVLQDAARWRQVLRPGGEWCCELDVPREPRGPAEPAEPRPWR